MFLLGHETVSVSAKKKSQLEYLKSKAGVLIKQAGPPDNKPGSKT